MRIPSHVALVAARSQWLRTRIRQAREARDKHLEKVCCKDNLQSTPITTFVNNQVFGSSVVPFKDLPLLEVRLRDAVPEAFEMVLNYIYTDCIDPTKKSTLFFPWVLVVTNPVLYLNSRSGTNKQSSCSADDGCI